LEKVANPDLDFNGKDKEFVANNPVGDTILEGRCGNSIRLGSRADYPHIFISNGRLEGGSVESLNDDNLISITSAGSISDHFNTDKFNRGRKSGDFLLASNKNEKRIIDFNDVDSPQIFINTDKITFNSKLHEITLSSGDNINIGSNNNLNISTNNSTIIESGNIYLGTYKNQPLVLGDELRKILLSFVKAVMGLKTTANAPAISGPPDPATISSLGDVLKALQTPEQTPFLSKFHFIENNDTQK
jgi:hypothetical protein